MYPPHYLGGYELACHDVVERWAASGHDVEVLTTTFRLPQPIHDTTPTVRVRRELEFYWRDHRILRPSILRRLGIERANRAAMTRALADFRPDVVSVWHMGAMSLGLLQTVVEQRIPLVLVVADQWLVYGGAVDAWMNLFAGRPRLGRLARIVTGLPTAWVPDRDDLTACFASEWLRARIHESSVWTPGHSTVTYLGVDPQRFTPSLQTHPWSSRLVCVGRVEERKGIHVAVEALAHLPDATLDVVGPEDGRYSERLRRIAVRNGAADRLHLRGAVQRRELPDRYRDADVFLFPVLWDEPFGLVPLEAMACGTPVVATGTGGSAEFLVDGVNCLLVPKGDDVALANAVRRLAEDETLRRSIVEHGHDTVAQLGIDRLAQVLERWHAAAADRYRGGIPADRPAVSATEAPSASERDRDA